MPPSIEFEITIVEASDIEARIRIAPRATDVDFTGTISGPYCEQARTLPATVPLRITDIDGQRRAEAIVPDPCFWTAELPYVYRLSVDFQFDGEKRRYEQSIGLQRKRDPLMCDRPLPAS